MINDTDTRIEWILGAFQKIARGEYDLGDLSVEKDDEIDAIAGGLVMVAEELAVRMQENERLHKDLLLEKERTISAQKEAIIELSTPVLRVWNGILVLPLIGTIDTTRAEAMAETLLYEIKRLQTSVAIIDITGIGVVDSNVAGHLITLIKASQMLGAQCVLSGVSPAVAQTLNKVDIPITEIVTKGSLQSALQYGLRVIGHNK